MAIGTRLRGILDELFSSADSTDELINELYYDRGYPESVAERIAYGELDMRPGAIAERRQDFAPNMETFYHGGAPEILKFGNDGDPFGSSSTFVSNSPMLANTYVTQPGAGTSTRQGQIYPLAVDTRDFMSTSARGQNWEDMQGLSVYDPYEKLYVVNDGVPLGSTRAKSFDTDQLAELAAGEGAPGIIIDDVVDIGPNFRAAKKAYRGNADLFQDFLRLEEGAKVAAINDQSRMRSLLGAAFDPEYKGSNILGDRAIPVAGAGLLAAAAMSPEEAEAGVIKTFGREFDPRFDPRVKEQEKLRDTTFTIEERGTQDAPRIPLADLEGRPFVTTMSDRTQAGGLLTGINDVALDRPINLQGGQGFMFENPGMTWASAPGVVTQIMNKAAEAGENPIYMPFRMAPTGGDFATMTGETMLSYASSNMNKAQKKELDKAVKEFVSKGSVVKGKRVGAGLKIKDWKGVDDPRSVDAFRNAPDSLRKELMNMIDVNFRNKGGLSIGQARLAVTEPGQADALDARIQNIGEIFTDRDIITESGHPSYPAGVPGQGLGRTDQEVSIFELLPDARYGEKQKAVKDPQRPTAREIRALTMKPYAGRITEDILRGLEARGVNVNANPLATAAAVSAGAELEGLLSQLPEKDEEAYSYGDILPIKRALDPEEREGILGGYSPAYTGIVEDLVEGLLTFKTQAEQGLYNPTAATEFLL